MIFMVGDIPSSKNIDPEIAFVGTPSYKNILYWVYRLNIDTNKLILCNRGQIQTYNGHFEVNCKHISCGIEPSDKIISLGNEASKALKAMNLEFYALPHPSPRNRKLNDKKNIDKLLKECRIWLGR